MLFFTNFLNLDRFFGISPTIASILSLLRPFSIPENLDRLIDCRFLMKLSSDSVHMRFALEIKKL